MVVWTPASQRVTDRPLLVCWCLCAPSLQPPEGEEKPPAGLQTIQATEKSRKSPDQADFKPSSFWTSLFAFIHFQGSVFKGPG